MPRAAELAGRRILGFAGGMVAAVPVSLLLKTLIGERVGIMVGVALCLGIMEQVRRGELPRKRDLLVFAVTVLLGFMVLRVLEGFGWW